MTRTPDDDLPPLPLGPNAPAGEARTPSATGYAPTPTGKSAARFTIANRRRQVAALVLARVDERTIARTLGVSRGTVAKDKARILVTWREAAERDILDSRAEAAAALDADEVRLRSVFDEVLRGKDVEGALEVYDRILKVADARARLLGLNAPEQREIRFPAAWRGATVVRDEPRPLDAARAAVDVLLAAGVFDRGLAALTAGPGDARAAGSGHAAEADPLRPDDPDA